MNKKEYIKLEASLLERGYKKYQQHWMHEDYGLGKGFQRENNKWDEERAGYQILLHIYDYSIHPEFHDRMPKEHREHVGIEVVVMVSRTIDERIDMAFAWQDDSTIERVENIAKHFYQWVCEEQPEPGRDIRCTNC